MPLTVTFLLIMIMLYALGIFRIIIEWLKTRILETNRELNGITFSIIIPFRNEERNIERCLKSILEQDYNSKLYEIICVDDHSEDNSASIVSSLAANNPQIKLINNPGFGKKKALRAGIDTSTYNHIITTDADTYRGTRWLSAFSTMFRYKGIKVVAGTVLMMESKNSVLQTMQVQDYMAMMAMSIVATRKGWFFNGSGGNLGFTKDIYLEYMSTGADNEITSGDDVFLLEYAAEHFNKSILFPKNNDITVFTRPEPDFTSFLNQRKRWANKSFNYRKKAMPAIWAFLWMINIGLIVELGLALFYGGLFIKVFAVALFGKLLVDYLFLSQITKFYNLHIKKFLISDLYHILYVTVIGIMAIFNSPFNWKGRKFSK